MKSFTFNEKFAAVLLVLFCPVYLVVATFIGPNSVLASEGFGAILLWRICWAVIAFVAFCGASATIFFKPAFHSSRLRMHAGRILPLSAMIVASLLSSIVMGMISIREERAFVDQNEHALSGIPPRALVYREGIPDGGIAVVRSPGRNPEDFTQEVMVELTGERIQTCERLTKVDWSCRFD